MDLSPGSLIVSLMVSLVGFSLFKYGKKMSRLPQMLGGLTMLIFPYFVGGVWLPLVIAAVLGLGVWLATKQGL